MILRRTHGRFVRLLLSIGMLLVITACRDDAASEGTGNLQIAVVAPAAGLDAETLVIAVMNAEGQPVRDAQISVEGNMNHAGMAPVMAGPVNDDADGTSDGHYQLPFQFSMLGDWILTVTVLQSDGSTVTKDLDVTVSDTGLTGEGVTDQGVMAHSSMDQSGMASDAMPAGLAVTNAMARAVPVAGTTGAVYLTLTNGTATADQLVSVATDIAEAAEMHETVNDNNVMRMEPRPDGFALPAGERVELTPGGKHIMLIGVKRALAEGESFTVTLTFAHADPQTIAVPVMAMDASMDHSNMGN